jgi:hypothetical protein
MSDPTQSDVGTISMFGDEGHTFFVTTTEVEFARVFECGSQYYDILVNSLQYSVGCREVTPDTGTETTSGRIASDHHESSGARRNSLKDTKVNPTQPLLPLFAALRTQGVVIQALEELKRSKVLYRKALPTLLDYFQSTKEARARWIVIGALKNSWASPYASAMLVNEFRKPDDEQTRIRWDIADALAIVASPDQLEDIISLFSDGQYGSAREMLAFALARLGKGNKKVISVLRKALGDEEVCGHSIIALGKLSAADAENEIETFLHHKKAWIRSEAKSALRRIRKG